MDEVLLLLHPDVLEVSPLLCHVHLSQNEAVLLGLQRLLCRQDLTGDSGLGLLPLATVGGLRPWLGLYDGLSAWLDLHDRYRLGVYMLGGEVVVPVDLFAVLLLPADYFLSLFGPFAGVEEGVVENDLFLLHVGGEDPLLGLDHVAVEQFRVQGVELEDEDLVDLGPLAPGVEVLEGLVDVPVIPGWREGYLTMR